MLSSDQPAAASVPRARILLGVGGKLGGGDAAGMRSGGHETAEQTGHSDIDPPGDKEEHLPNH